MIQHRQRIAELEASHRQLRAALISASRTLRRLEGDESSLPKLKEVLRDARLVAKRRAGDPVLIRRAS